jgi:GTP pyrophosphokinase
MSKAQILQKENELMDRAFEDLLNDYLNSNHSKNTEIIRKAYQFAKAAHAGVRRRSGEPYIIHPIAVAHIVCKDIGLGSTSICAALLHDVVEDTEYTVDDIKDLFGEKIAEIVKGLTKISGGVFGDQASAQAENFRKLIITMSKDIRVVLIKIADRLHNMRTLDSQSVAKQYKIAGETEYIYAPLAHRLGLFTIKTELEDLSFKYNFPEKYNSISERLEAEREKRMAVYDNFSLPIMNKLNSYGYEFVMKERIKSAFSIWKKMEAKRIPFEEVYDILGARIVFKPHPGADEKLECFKIYNLITSIYTLHPGRTRDWLSTPKANGYEALHVTVMGPDGQWIEVQIRSQRMDDIAEKGLAAHWNYKKDYSSSESKIEEWLSTVNEILKNPDSNAMHFLDTFKLALYDTEVFVFTPKGEMKTLPSGATALDFAFDIHSDIGMHCIGAKVNNKLVPLNYVLQGGDQIEILTAKQQEPQPEWINYVTTVRAKEKLNTIYKQNSRLFRQKGERILRDTLEALGYVVKKDFNNDVIKLLLDHFKLDNFEEVLTKLGKEEISLIDVPNLVKNKNRRISFTSIFSSKGKKTKEKETTQKYCLAPCCKPIPGDDIIGFKSEEGIVIHKRDCPEALRYKSQYGPKIVEAKWENTEDKIYNATIEVEGIDRKHILMDILKIISEDLDANIKKLTVNTFGGIFNAKINIYVSHVNDIKKICKEALKINGIERATRVNEHDI